MLAFILFTFAIGATTGALARVLAPGRVAMSTGGAMVLGMVGSFIGGLAGYVLTHRDPADPVFHISGVAGSVIGAAAALLSHRAATRPGDGRLA